MKKEIKIKTMLIVNLLLYIFNIYIFIKDQCDIEDGMSSYIK